MWFLGDVGCLSCVPRVGFRTRDNLLHMTLNMSRTCGHYLVLHKLSLSGKLTLPPVLLFAFILKVLTDIKHDIIFK